MKKLMNFTGFFGKLNEKFTYDTFFNNESQLKDILLKNKHFSNDDVIHGITVAIYDDYDEKFKKNNVAWDQLKFYSWIKSEYGIIPYFTLLFSNYNGQVCNGGHSQYFGNGYASSNPSGMSGNYIDIATHEEFTGLFFDLDLNNILPSGQIAMDIIDSFELDLDDEIEDCSSCGGKGVVECDECDGACRVDCSSCCGSGKDDEQECSECSGDGQIECEYCHGDGEQECTDCSGDGEINTGFRVPDTESWSELDDRWYKIDEKIVEEYNNYLKTLTLDDEKISDLAEYANSSQKYNI